MPEEQVEEVIENPKVVIGILIALVVIGLIVGAGYLFSRKRSGQTVLPAGYQPPLAISEIDCLSLIHI